MYKFYLTFQGRMSLKFHAFQNSNWFLLMTFPYNVGGFLQLAIPSCRTVSGSFLDLHTQQLNSDQHPGSAAWTLASAVSCCYCKCRFCPFLFNIHKVCFFIPASHMNSGGLVWYTESCGFWARFMRVSRHRKMLRAAHWDLQKYSSRVSYPHTIDFKGNF